MSINQQHTKSEFSHLRGQELIQALKDKYKKPQIKTAEPSLGNFAATTSKGLVSGAVGGVADTLTMPYNLLATAHNTQRQAIDPEIRRIGAAFNPDAPDMPYDVDLPMIPSATEAIDKGIDRMTGGYTTTPESQKPFHEGVKLAASVATPAGLGKASIRLGAKALGSAFNAIGSLKPSALAGAGAAGAATEAAQQAGHSGGRSLGEGLGAGLLADLAVRKLNPSSLARNAVSLSGFGKKNLDIDAIEAAQRLNIELPNSAFTNSPVAHLSTQTLGKMPFYGTWLKRKFAKASDDYKGAFSKTLNDVGPKKTEAIQKEIDNLYEKTRESLPEIDTVQPDNLLKSIQKFERQKVSNVPNSQLDVVRRTMNALKEEITGEALSLPDEFKKLPRDVQLKVLDAIEEQTKLLDVPVSTLVDQKQNINATLRDKNVFNTNDTTISNMLISPKKAIDLELEKYGQKNPEFLKNMKEANKLYSDVAKRESFEKLLSSVRLDSPDEVLYGSISNILGDRKNDRILKNSLGAANFKKVKDLEQAAKAMKNIQKYNPNPSGSAILAFIGAMFASKGSALAALGMSPIVYWSLTNKKFLNLATRYAKEPTPALSNQISNIFQKETGMSIQTANKIMHEKKEE